LDCLLDVPSSIPYASLFPYKKAVAKALMVGDCFFCFSDCDLLGARAVADVRVIVQELLEHEKRAVRRRAGVARNVWMCMST
jgi:hypothetical protein